MVGHSEASAAYVERAEHDQAWVAELHGKAIGLMVLTDPGFSAIDIHFLAVRREAIGKGLEKRWSARLFSRPVRSNGPI